MPFEPGNKLGELARGIPKPHNAERRKYERSLAMQIRERVKPDAVIAWLEQVWAGRDPLTNEIVPLEQRERALKMLLDRGWGQAAQMLVIEGQITTENASSAPATDRPRMTLEQINAKRARIRAELESGEEAIDAVCTEVP